MKTYYLKSKLSKEVISKSVFESLSIAIEYFSEVKRLNPEELLKIYIVNDSELK
jgi:hypothetical protein